MQAHQTSEAAKVLLWAGGVATTVAGSWIASKIRVFDDNRKAHFEDLRQRMLVPLLNTVTENLPLFGHEQAVVVETYGNIGTKKQAKATEDHAVLGMMLESFDPWPQIFDSVDGALFEDAKITHFKKLIHEVVTFAESWGAHSSRCLRWVGEVSTTVLSLSKMNPYKSPYTVPYILHFRLGVFVYRRLFGLPTEALRKNSEGQYMSIQGATQIPNQVGISSLGCEKIIDELLVTMDRIIESNAQRAAQLQAESRTLRSKALELRSTLELAVASKRLKGHCALVPFF